MRVFPKTTPLRSPRSRRRACPERVEGTHAAPRHFLPASLIPPKRIPTKAGRGNFTPPYTPFPNREIPPRLLNVHRSFQNKAFFSQKSDLSTFPLPMDKTSSGLALYVHHRTRTQASRETIATYRGTVHGNPKCNCGPKDMTGRQCPYPQTNITPILIASVGLSPDLSKRTPGKTAHSSSPRHAGPALGCGSGIRPVPFVVRPLKRHPCTRSRRYLSPRSAQSIPSPLRERDRVRVFLHASASPSSLPPPSPLSVIPAKAGIQRNAEPPTTPCARSKFKNVPSPLLSRKSGTQSHFSPYAPSRINHVSPSSSDTPFFKVRQSNFQRVL